MRRIWEDLVICSHVGAIRRGERIGRKGSEPVSELCTIRNWRGGACSYSPGPAEQRRIIISIHSVGLDSACAACALDSRGGYSSSLVPLYNTGTRFRPALLQAFEA